MADDGLFSWFKPKTTQEDTDRSRAQVQSVKDLLANLGGLRIFEGFGQAAPGSMDGLAELGGPLAEQPTPTIAPPAVKPPFTVAQAQPSPEGKELAMRVRGTPPPSAGRDIKSELEALKAAIFGSGTAPTPAGSGGGGGGSAGAPQLDIASIMSQGEQKYAMTTADAKANLTKAMDTMKAGKKDVAIKDSYQPGTNPVIGALLSGLAGLGSTLGRIAGSQNIVEGGKENQARLDSVLLAPFMDAFAKDQIYKLPPGLSQEAQQKMSERTTKRIADLESKNQDIDRAMLTVLTQKYGMDSQQASNLVNMLGTLSGANLQSQASIAGANISAGASRANNRDSEAGADRRQQQAITADLAKALLTNKDGATLSQKDKVTALLKAYTDGGNSTALVEALKILGVDLSAGLKEKK